VSRDSTRRVISGIAFVLGFAVFAPPVGQTDGSEAHAINALRSAAADLAEASRTEGFDTLLACLATPPCIPPQRDHNSYLDGQWQLRPRSRYRLEFHAAAPIDSQRNARTRSRFAIVALPVGNESATRRWFCIDDRRQVYAGASHTMPHIDAGRCANTSDRVR
jgi:hypothetical protein